MDINKKLLFSSSMYYWDGFVTKNTKSFIPLIFKTNCILKYTFSVAFSVCTLDTTADNNIVQTNGTHTEYLKKLIVECKHGYKLSRDSVNSATNTTLSCQESGEFESPPVCVKKGNNIRTFVVIRKTTCICL